MNHITKIKAREILKINDQTLRNLMKSKKIIELDKKSVLLSSVLEMEKELEERRSIISPNWIKNGGCASI